MQVDKYGTVGPHTIIRQHMDYGHWLVFLWPLAIIMCKELHVC